MSKTREEILRDRGSLYIINDLDFYASAGIYAAMEEYSQQQLSELKKENEELTLQIQVANAGNQILESQFNKAKELLTQIDKSLYLGEDLNDKEIMQHYIDVVTIIKSEIETFLSENK